MAIIIIVLILIGGAYFVFSKKIKMLPPQNPENQSSQSSQSSSENLSIDDWKTYRNDQYGFEVKYPSKNYKLFDKSGDDGEILLFIFAEPIYDDVNSVEERSSYFLVSHKDSIYKGKIYSDTRKYVDELIKDTGLSEKIERVSSVNLGTVNGVKVEGERDYGVGKEKFSDVYAIIDGVIYTIKYKNNPTFPEFYPVLVNIEDSFKFTR